jgi:hypothetical protein
MFPLQVFLNPSLGEHFPAHVTRVRAHVTAQNTRVHINTIKNARDKSINQTSQRNRAKMKAIPDAV